MKKLLFDTDIGSDIDDALALAYLLKEPECDLLGITTVSGEPIKRAELASAICHAAGRDDIPIYPGLSKPFAGKNLQPASPQYDNINGWEHKTGFPQFEAIQFMRKTIRENPNEITLLAVGPMTNVDALFTLDPEIPSLLKEFVIMCGNFSPSANRSEWNAKCDGAAVSGIYAANVRRHISFGLNVTLQLTISRDDVEREFTAPIMQPVKAFAARWFNGEDKRMIFHDPLAAMGVFHPEVCTYKTGTVSISMDDFGFWGKTTFREAPDGKHEIAVSVDHDGFFKRYFETVNR